MKISNISSLMCQLECLVFGSDACKDNIIKFKITKMIRTHLLHIAYAVEMLFSNLSFKIL